MTEFDAILEDIRTNPAADLPRLALADWLMEQDDAASRSRGEFIHARCRAASLPPRDPERAALQLRAEELRDEHEIEWLVSLDLGYTGLRCEGIRTILEKPHLPSLRILLVDNNGISADGVQALAASTDLPRLMRLDLSRNPIEDRGASTLARYSQFDGLRELRLASCGIGKRGGIALATSAALANLPLLDLSDNPLDETTRAELRERFGNRVILG